MRVHTGYRAVVDSIRLPSGTWTVVEQIGDSSGMGQVFRTTLGEETCAIKVIDEVGEQVRDELANEVPDSKYVVPILESGSDGGRTFLRMPLADYSLEGFRKARSSGTLTVEEAISALHDISTGLTEIGAQVTHRDIKPDNVLWYNGRWCLTDFGLARIADATTGTVTRKGWGTVQYVAPELLLGGRASAKSDIYALGISAYRLLTGKYPFEDGKVLSDDEIIQWHINGRIAKPNSDSPQLDSLVVRMLMKAPEARPTARDVRDKLSMIEEGPKFSAVGKLHKLAAERDLAAAEAGRQHAEQATREKNRHRLADSARFLADIFMSNLKESLDSVSGIEQRERMGDTVYRFGQATLVISPMQSVPEIPSIPFDVVAAFEIRIEQDVAQKNWNWNGRQHSLWFCDPEEKGSYDWYETAFFQRSRSRLPIEPYGLTPMDAQSAFTSAITSVQVARKFFRVSDEQADEFINRWIEYFTQAAQGGLYYPMILPEGERPVWRMQ